MRKRWKEPVRTWGGVGWGSEEPMSAWGEEPVRVWGWGGKEPVRTWGWGGED